MSCLRCWLSNSCECVWSQNEIVQVCEVDHSRAHCDWQVIQILWYLESRELAHIFLSLNNAGETLNLAEAVPKITFKKCYYSLQQGHKQNLTFVTKQHHYEVLVLQQWFCQQGLFSRCKKTCMFDTDPNKCHIILNFIVFFGWNKDDDAKMTIPTSRESYHKCNLSEIAAKWLFDQIMQHHQSHVWMHMHVYWSEIWRFDPRPLLFTYWNWGHWTLSHWFAQQPLECTSRCKLVPRNDIRHKKSLCQIRIFFFLPGYCR